MVILQLQQRKETIVIISYYFDGAICTTHGSVCSKRPDTKLFSLLIIIDITCTFCCYVINVTNVFAWRGTSTLSCRNLCLIHLYKY
jgi:hypothetical protein